MGLVGSRGAKVLYVVLSGLKDLGISKGLRPFVIISSRWDFIRVEI